MHRIKVQFLFVFPVCFLIVGLMAFLPQRTSAQEPLNDYDEKETTTTPTETRPVEDEEEDEDDTNFITSPLPGQRPIRKTPGDSVDSSPSDEGTTGDESTGDDDTSDSDGIVEQEEGGEEDVETVIPIYIISTPGCPGCDIVEDLPEDLPVQIIYIDPTNPDNKQLLENLEQLIGIDGDKITLIIGDTVIEGIDKELLLQYIDYLRNNGSPDMVAQLLYAGAKNKLLGEEVLDSIKIKELDSEGVPVEFKNKEALADTIKTEVEDVTLIGGVPLKLILSVLIMEALMIFAFLFGISRYFKRTYFSPVKRNLIKTAGVVIILVLGALLILLI